MKKEKAEYGNWLVLIKEDENTIVETYFRASNIRECIERVNAKREQIEKMGEIVPCDDEAFNLYRY